MKKSDIIKLSQKLKINLILGGYSSICSFILLSWKLWVGITFYRDFKVLRLVESGVDILMKLGLVLIVLSIFIALKNNQRVVGQIIGLIGYLCYAFRYFLILVSGETIKVDNIILASLLLVLIGGILTIKDNLSLVKNQTTDDNRVKNENEWEYRLVFITIISYYSIFSSLVSLGIELLSLFVFGRPVSFIYVIVTLYLLDKIIIIGLVLTIISIVVTFLQSKKDKQLIFLQMLSFVIYFLTFLGWKNGNMVDANIGLLVIATINIILITMFVKQRR